MYRPDKYDVHDLSFNRFANCFNSCPIFPNITICANANETYTNDGYICINGIKVIGYDWEKRDGKTKDGNYHFINGKLLYPDLGQFERKLYKGDIIKLALQCDTNETSVAVAWHEDWLKEDIETLDLKTSSQVQKNGKTRYTTKFKIFSYGDLSKLKIAIAYAIYSNNYTYDSFSPISSELLSEIKSFSMAFDLQRCYKDYLKYAPKIEEQTVNISSINSNKAMKNNTPTCPHCHSILIEMPGRYGKPDFYACPNYKNGCPGCMIPKI